jgi:tryptophan synthase alpha subunit
MGHLVLGYPTLAQSIDTARQYVQAGVAILELQIPFSDPSADGYVITHANQQAVAQGATVPKCMEVIASLRSEFPGTPLLVMTYANKVYRYGVARFAQQLLAVGVTDVIIPDLALESPQAQELLAAGLRMVPVLGANTDDARLSQFMALKPAYWYLMADFKITGQSFTLHEDLVNLIRKIQNQSDGKIGIGFGISSAAHLEAVGQIADFAIVGSALITAQEEGKLTQRLLELVG